MKLLAVGGFGRIFLARDRILGRQVVIKSLREELLGNPEYVEKFIAEAKLTAQLDHPAIVPSYSLDGDSMDGLHLAMQFIRGETLKELLRRCREEKDSDLPFRNLRTRLEAFLRVCDAMEYSHSRGIIHCDLKPENIMIGRHGEVYVMDWGIASPVGTDRRGHLNGTPAYMAPEALTRGETGPQTDLFALGMILNEIVTLCGPVTGADSREVIARICAGKFEPSTPIVPKLRISPALRAIIEKARAVDPAERYPSVRQLAQDVRRWLFNEEVSACPDSLLQKLMRYMYCNRNVTVLTLAMIFCCSAAMALFGLYREFHVEEKTNFEILRLAKLQHFTETRAVEIDNQLLRIQEQLKMLGTSFGIEIDKPGLIAPAASFHPVSDFAPNSATPQGVVMAPFYGREISLNYASWVKPENMPHQQVEEIARKIRLLHRPVLALLLNSVTNRDGVELSAEQSMQIFLEKGGLVRRINICFSNGVALRFPGMYEKDLTIDDIQGQWIRDRRKLAPHRLYWSLPYVDGTGHAVISCWGPILDCVGNELGSIGIEICFADLVRELFAQNEREQFQTTYFLLNEDGTQLFSTADGSLKQTHHGVRPPLRIGGHPFRYPQLLSRFTADSDKQFIAELDGKPVRVSWTAINQTGWILVQLVPRNEVELLDLNLDARTRRNVREEF
ncbi:MAG: protein kinase [Lentisphaeria bacterium]|nr:protein kinase [Lentisphaeria bacterium]